MTIYLNPKQYPDLTPFSPEEKSEIIKHVYASNHLSTWQGGLTALFSTFSILLFYRVFNASYDDDVSIVLFGFLIFCFLLIGILVSLIIHFIGINTIFKHLVQNHIALLKNEN